LAYLTNFFRGGTAQNETVIFVEDVHWADSTSLDFIAHLAAELPDRRLYCSGWRWVIHPAIARAP
jgi:predicted ATPase